MGTWVRIPPPPPTKISTHAVDIFVVEKRGGIRTPTCSFFKALKDSVVHQKNEAAHMIKDLSAKAEDLKEEIKS